MILYKLTNADGFTRNGVKWEVGRTVLATSRGEPELCTGTVLHAYPSALMAALMNPGPAGFVNPRCFLVQGEVAVTDGLKVGARSLRVVWTFVLPEVSASQHVAFGILCALETHRDPAYARWARAWLEGDKSIASASGAASEAVAFYAAQSGHWDPAAAAYAAAVAATVAATHSDPGISRCATYAAYAASYAARASEINFQSLAERAMEYE